MTNPNLPQARPRELLSSAPLLAPLFDTATCALFVKDDRGRYLFANPACRAILANDGPLEGETDHAFFDRATADALHGAARQARAAGRAVDTEIAFSRGGKYRTCVVSTWPVLDGQGEPGVVCGMIVDVNEDRRADGDHASSQRKFRELVDSIDGIVWEQDPTTLRFTYVSHQAERLLGYPLGEWFDSPGAWLTHLHPDDRETALSFCRRETAAGRDHSFEYRIIAADGRIVWLRDIVTVAGEPGRPTALRGVMVDVTDVRQAQQRLRESERRLELALEGAGLYFWDLEVATGRIEYAGDFPASLGYGPQDVPSTAEAWTALVHPEDRPAAQAAWIAHLKGHSDVFSVEVRVRCRDDTWRWIQVRGTVVERDANGRALRVLGTDLDVTERKEAEDAVRESEERFRATFEQAAVGMAHFSPQGKCLRANRKFADLTGYAREELVGMHFSVLTHPDDVDRVADTLDRMCRGEVDAFQLEKRYRRKEGSYMWGETTISTTRTENGGTRLFTVVCTDITERIENARRLDDLQSKLQLATSIAEVGFWELDLRTRAVFFSPGWKRHLGYADDELPNRYEEWASRVHPDDLQMVLARDWRLSQPAAPSHDQFEYRMRHRDGSYRWILSRFVPRRDTAGAIVALSGIHLDITERKAAEDKIRQASQHDPLTGLPNRALIYEFGEHLLAGARRTGMRAAVLFIDLDRFKAINDTYGHDVGDKLLQEVAGRLRACVRGEDLIGRLGGDEFLAVLANIRGDGDPVRVATNMLDTVSRPCLIDGLQLEVSPSIGISLHPQDGRGIDALIKHADAAMFHAKEGGRNNFQFFRAELNKRVAEALRIENRMKHALDDAEFVLFYQPIIDTETEAVVAAEALIRWPAMQIGPDRFIPVAETTGFMQPLGAWVLREACRQHKEWHAHGLPNFPVAVNVSATQFRQKNFFDSVCEAMITGALAPGDLHVEVTESAVMKNVEEAAETLHALRSQGVKVALDDFGTGYSSLSYLRWLPLDILKVDKSFVQNLAEDPASLAIAEAIIALGDSLGLEIIAEGIESGDTARLLKRRHCRRGQGFHYCRPIPARDFEAWYKGRPASGGPASGGIAALT